MSDKFVKVAIDHGTTNSAIAVMGKNRPSIIKPSPTEATMPSAVYYSKTGALWVGREAYDAIFVTKSHEGKGHIGYKLLLGQDERFSFEPSDKVHTAPELGGIVIGELLKRAAADLKHPVNSAVITIPAKFEQNAIEGTREAARLAGLDFYPLLQEPVAAALAYGFSAKEKGAKWIVFDIGGGTLDVSLVTSKDRRLTVPENGNMGDNTLGGRRFDRDIMDYVLEYLAGQDFSLKNFKHGSSEWGRLMLAIEKCKIELSKRDESRIEIDGLLCHDDNDKPIRDLSIPLTRKDYEAMISPHVDKAVNICQNLMNANRLTAPDLDGIILVGGPTKTPYIQQVLKNRLKVPLIDAVDPMTVVALGAAIYASTQEIPAKFRNGSATPPGPDSLAIHLEYEGNSTEPTYYIFGKVTGKDPAQGDLFVEIQRDDGEWKSERIPLDEDGGFEAVLLLINAEEPTLSTFTTSVVNVSGKVLASIEEPKIRYPMMDVSSAMRATSSLAIAIVGNRTSKLIDKGANLPARGRGTFHTAKKLRHGSDDTLVIPVLELIDNSLGTEDDHADCGLRVGDLVVSGKHIPIDLPQDSEMEISLEQNPSREIKVVTYFPLIEEEFAATFEKANYGITLDQVKERYEFETWQFEKVKQLQARSPLPSVEADIKRLEEQQTLENIAKEIERAEQEESGALQKAWKYTLEMAGAIHKMRDDQIEVRMAARMEDIRNTGNPEDQSQLKLLEQALQAGEKSIDRDQRRKIDDEIDDLHLQVMRRPYWTLYVRVRALGGLRVTTEQHAIHSRAFDLEEELDKKGAPNYLTTDDLQRINTSNRELEEAFPDLNEHVDRWLKKNPAYRGGVTTDVNQR